MKHDILFRRADALHTKLKDLMSYARTMREIREMLDAFDCETSRLLPFLTKDMQDDLGGLREDYQEICENAAGKVPLWEAEQKASKPVRRKRRAIAAGKADEPNVLPPKVQEAADGLAAIANKGKEESRMSKTAQKLAGMDFNDDPSKIDL